MSRQEIADKYLSKFISRKLIVFVIGSVALFTGNVESGDWVIISSVYISLEGATTIVEKILKAKLNNNQSPNLE
jgi:hypothetical protein